MSNQPNVYFIGPTPPEVSAYSLSRYSRSSDSIKQSLEWVRERDSSKFLDSFYFQYGHASIADLGHTPVCFEGISELAATEIEDEQLWDGQARSSRYQNFGAGSYVIPPELTSESDKSLFRHIAELLLEGYRNTFVSMFEAYKVSLSRERPETMTDEAFLRTCKARAFDVARYLLFWGIPTGVGQVTSIRTLEKQLRRWMASEYQELRDLAETVKTKLTLEADVQYYPDDRPIAPTLAKYLVPEQYPGDCRKITKEWIESVLHGHITNRITDTRNVTLSIESHVDSIAASTFLYQTLPLSYSYIQTIPKQSLAMELVQAKPQREELTREFRSAPLCFDITCDIGAYRDLHRHRRALHFRKPYSFDWGYSIPEDLIMAGDKSLDDYISLMESVKKLSSDLPDTARQYLIPFGYNVRFLMKMDLAELEYIGKLRTGVKGHISYRKTAWNMVQEAKQLSLLAGFFEATNPEIKDQLTR